MSLRIIHMLSHFVRGKIFLKKISLFSMIPESSSRTSSAEKLQGNFWWHSRHRVLKYLIISLFSMIPESSSRTSSAEAPTLLNRVEAFENLSRKKSRISTMIPERFELSTPAFLSCIVKLEIMPLNGTHSYKSGALTRLSYRLII